MPTIQRICLKCKKAVETGITPAEWQNYLRTGLPIQIYFSYIKPEIREMFISGICGECWDSMFKEENGDEN